MDPLTSPDCDLQDFPFMPLHVARLRDSDLAAEEDPVACWYAVLLWAASWHQLPAASLPDNDAVLMRLVGLGRDTKTWKRHRTGALRGWIKCSDGRLYHPVVAEQANSAWQEKLAYRDRKQQRIEIARKAAAARWQGDEQSSPPPDADASSIADAMPKGRGTGTGIYSEDKSSGASAAAEPPDDPSKSLFDRGVTLLVAKGKTEPAARTILAKFQRDFGDAAVLGAIERCRGATDPVSAMRAHLGKAKSQSEYLGV